MSGPQTGTGAVRHAPPYVDIAAARLLDSAAALITGKGWTQGAAARDTHSMGCAATSDRAVSWCATGALVLAEYDTGLRKLDGKTTYQEDENAYGVRLRAEAALKVSAGIEFITGWNDRRGQTAANVAGAMRAAAAGLRAAPTDTPTDDEWQCPACYPEPCMHGQEMQDGGYC